MARVGLGQVFAAPTMMRLFNRGREADESPPPAPSSSSTPAATVTGPARPLRLVYCDEKGKFRMDPEAVAVLQLVKEPIGVVSVCGRSRQGKSFILNQVALSLLSSNDLLGETARFRVCCCLAACRGLKVILILRGLLVF